ncbi:hypothetical protein GCM10014715_25420 [Streptomyces spiralis]|uniref:Uncharacterized protein n=1 Tax=Streptomyces spiralis TaxID=66376 RepID=A0A919DS35_9ACTN|nr:hypothetical protein GCM10014715_25420 [Streptomyces spiralis]
MLKLVWEGNPDGCRAAAAAYGPGIREGIFRADRAVRPTPSLGVGWDAQARGSCRAATRCHTYVAVGYGTVGSWSFPKPTGTTGTTGICPGTTGICHDPRPHRGRP